MAKRQTTRTRTTRSRQETPARSSTRRETVQVAQTVAVSEADKTDGMTGTVVLTTVLLLIAILCVDKLLGSYGAGVFF